MSRLAPLSTFLESIVATTVASILIVGSVAPMVLGTPRPSVSQRRGPETTRRNADDLPAGLNRERISNALRNLSISFEANQGQADHKIKFFSHGNGYSLSLTSTESVLTLSKMSGEAHKNKFTAGVEKFARSRQRRNAVIRMKLAGANPNALVKGTDELPGKINYFTGSDPKNWRTGIASYARVKYHQVYPGIDLVYYGKDQHLEYDFVIAPGADPKKIRMQFKGVGKSEVNAQGDLVLHTTAGEIRHRKPFIYQEVNGTTKLVDGHFRLLGKNSVSFEIGNYDIAKPLVIDPAIVYSTLLGDGDFFGAQGFGGNGIAVHTDANGNTYAYVVGGTVGAFPTKNALQPNFAEGNSDVFVVKLNMAASGDASLLYSTYLGGTGYESASGIAVDSAGNAYLAGGTGSINFPTEKALPFSSPGSGGAFVTKLNADGSQLLYSTYVPGTGRATGIAIDSAGNAYIAGATSSDNLPTVNAYQTTRKNASAINTFVCKIAPPSGGNPTALLYSTYLGGTTHNFADVANAIAVDSSGKIYLAGDADSEDFPVKNGFQSINKGPGGYPTAFVTVLDSSLAGPASLLYSTYLGGSAPYGDHAAGIAVDASGNAYVTGYTLSVDFPVTPGAYQSTLAGRDAFVAKIDPLRIGSASLIYATYLGGAILHGETVGSGIAVDSSGNAFVTGNTTEYDFPTVNAVQTANNGVFQSINGGNSWLAINNGLTTPVINSLAIDETVIPRTFYAGTPYGVFKSTNGGTNWSQINGNGSINAAVLSLAINPLNSSNLYAGTSNGVFKTTDGGTTWNSLNSGLSEWALTGINVLTFDTVTTGSAPTAIIYAGTNDGMYKLLDGANVWNETGLFQGIDSFVIDPKTSPHTLYAGSFIDHRIYKGTPRTDGSEIIDWVDAHSGYIDLEAIAIDTGTTPSTLYASDWQNDFAGSDPPLWKSSDNGATWEPMANSTGILGSGDPRKKIAFDTSTSPSMIYLSDNYNGLAKSADGGVTWNRIFRRGVGDIVVDTAATAPSPIYVGTGQVEADAFIAELNPTGSALLFSTYLGGFSEDVANGIALDAHGNIYVTGFSKSVNFPTINAYQSDLRGNSAFVTKLGSAALPQVSAESVTTQVAVQTGSLELTFPNITGSTSSSPPTTTVNALDSATTANLTLSNNLGAYEIKTTATYDTSGYATDPTTGIKIAFTVPTVNDLTVFNNLVITHGEDSNGDNVIQPSEMIPYNGTVDPNKITYHDFDTRTIWVFVPSLSPFVIVKGAADQFSDLVRLIKSFNLKAGIENSLDAKLQNALKAYQAALAKDRPTACNQMGAFTSEVRAQTNKSITLSQADQLLSAANQIKRVVGCQ